MDKSEYFTQQIKRDLIDNELHKSLLELKVTDPNSVAENENHKKFLELYQDLVASGDNILIDEYIELCVVNTISMLLAGIDGSFDIGTISEGLELSLDGEIISGSLREEFNAAIEDDTGSPS
ncbi:hypothetical protein [Enterovibrio coralii]|uniref:Uncharacterized protein n=1 Tax=Enterovibrio coralii TaxID=294935 RepID=A0A135IA44_9GAMM|nr:hypothetical protein [Enterovibrio coralii]KXF82268.1 hypothetical protein ATN88_08795 [Enterovibrio coralii]